MALSINVSELYDLKTQLGLMIRKVAILQELMGDKSIADFGLLLDKMITQLKQEVSIFPSFDLSVVLISRQFGLNLLDIFSPPDIVVLMDIHQILKLFVERNGLMK